MSGFKSGAILLFLSIPVLAYCAWQVQGVSRTDLMAASPPSDKGMPTKEQITAQLARAEKWSGDVRKLESVAFQFRAPGADDATADEDCTVLAKSIAARSSDLTDLDRFLSGVDSPAYTGSLKNKYQEWQASKVLLSKSEKVIEEWFTTPLTGIENSAAATGALSAFLKLVADYTSDSRFSDPTRAAAWKVRARVRVIEALADSAIGPYQKVIKLKLPLPTAAESADVKKALEAPPAIREHVKLLQTELTQAEDARLSLPGRILGDAKETIKLADEWAARERLLALFAEPNLFVEPAGAADWLAKVQVQFNRTSSGEERLRLQEKVQEFCETFVPTAVQLDDSVLLDGKPVPRAKIEVKYYPRPGAASERIKLTTMPAGLNEFNLTERYPGDTLVVYDASEYYPRQLQPTPLSQAAMSFLAARTELRSGTGAPKWSANSIEVLKNKCKTMAAEVNKLKMPGGKPENPRIWDRLQNLSEGAATNAPLFTKGQ
jgi:hypothetical protein